MPSAYPETAQLSLIATRRWWSKRRRMVWAVIVAVLASFLVVGIHVAPAGAVGTTGSISGNVKGLGTPNVNLQGVDVQVWAYGSNTDTTDVLTDSSGNYTVSGLAAGTYTLEFYEGTDYITQWWSGTSDVDQATYFDLGAGLTLSGKNVVLVPGATISGKIQGHGSPNVNLVNTEVIAFASGGFTSGIYSGNTGTYLGVETDASGNFTILDLPAGNYTLEALPDPGDDYVTGYWSGQTSLQSAIYFPVSVGQAITGKDMVLSSGSTISGTVMGQGSPDAPLENADVNAYNVADNSLSYEAQADSDGNYSIVGLPAGTYELDFGPEDLQHLGESLPNHVVVGAAQVVGSQNITLPLGATISGNVQNAGTPNLPAQDLEVCVEGATIFVYLACGNTDASGNYTFTGIPAGSYTVDFNAFRVLGEQWWNDKSTFESADFFTVAAGQTVTGKNALFPAVGSISGNVKSQASNHALEGVEVFVRAADGTPTGVDVMTDANGNYSAAGLSPGTYSVEFAPNASVLPAGNYADSHSALNIVVAPGQNVTGANVNMAAGGSVSGNVKGPSNLILSGVEVDIMAQDGFSYGYPASGDSGTDANGNFTVDGLPAGSYTVSFSSWALGSYTDQWWQNQPSFGSANFFTVSAGQTVTGKNTTLGRLATISGNVKGAGAPNANLAGVNVVAIPVDTGPVLGVGDGPTYYAQTDAAGNFTITGLDPDSYTLEFIPGWPDFGGLNYVYAGEYWGGKSSEGTASYFPVSSGQTVTGRDIVLPASSSVSGTVTSSGVPLQGIISVYDTSGSADSQSTLVTDVHTNVDGTYTVPGLGAGSYRVGFSTQTGGYEFEPGFAANEALVADASGYALASSDPYVSQWYSGKYSYSSAGSVVVPSAGAAVTGINFTIENPTFADVSDPSYSFYPYIQWMSSTGISTGTGQPTGKPLYKPSAAVSRQAMASFMYKLSGTTFVPPGTPTFADVDSSSPFYTAVEWMASTGISTGTGQPSGKPLFKPTDAVSRSAMALFLARYDHVDTSTAPASQSFADVPVTASSAAAIAWMASSGISTGTAQPSGLPVYLPANPVSRSAMAAFLYRLAHLPA